VSRCSKGGEERSSSHSSDSVQSRELSNLFARDIRKISFELCGCWTKEERTHSEGSYKNGESFRDSSVSLKGGGRRRDGQIERFWQVQKRESFLTSAA